MINEISSVLSFKSSFPMKKETSRYSNIFSPNYMVRFAPGHMRNMSGDDIALNYNNLFSTNKTSIIEDGLSTVLGFNYVVNEKNEQGKEREKLSLSMGQIFNLEENKDLPSKSSLDQKMSDVVGEMKYNFSKIGNINYKLSIDHNLNQLNYNEISSTFNFGKVDFNLDYLEERSHIGNEHYVSSGITLNINDNNKLSFGTKKNYKTRSTEFYDLQYDFVLLNNLD
jgi:LPS-assembly protein